MKPTKETSVPPVQAPRDNFSFIAPFPAYGFAALVSHNENLNSPKQGP